MKAGQKYALSLHIAADNLQPVAVRVEAQNLNGEDIIERKYGKDFFAKIAKLEGVYRGEFMASETMTFHCHWSLVASYVPRSQ